MTRIEGALFYGPSATWTMENRREADDPEVKKGFLVSSDFYDRRAPRRLSENRLI